MLKNQRPFLTTGIGSLPHTDPYEAVNLVLSTFDIPFWPQLPKISFREQMIPQYTEGLPFVKIDEGKKTVFAERGRTDELERFYESVRDDMRLAISESYAEGLHVFLQVTKGKFFKYLKGQVTGPLTFTLGLNDSSGRPVYFDEELREVYLMCLKAKARWQVDMLKARAGDVLIFIDEPIASSLGSTAYISVSREESLRLLREMAGSIRESGGIPGIHCCGRAEWPLFLESGIDILSFDAFDYGETIALYPNEIKTFLEYGGTLAWGMVPTTEAITEQNEDKLYGLFMDRLDYLARSIPRTLLTERIMLTPSCGTGSLSVEQAMKVFQLLVRLKEALS